MSEESALKIGLQTTSVVNEISGEVSTTKEAIDALRDLEREVTRIDEQIDALALSLKDAKHARERAIGALRQKIRDSSAQDLTLPLFGDKDAAVDDDPDGP